MGRVYGRMYSLAVSHKRTVKVFLILLIAGCAVGNFYAGFISEDRLSELKNGFTALFESGGSLETDRLSMFFSSFKEYTYSFIPVLVCSFSVWGIPIVLLMFVYLGFSAGFSSALIVRLFGLKGFLMSGTMLLLSNLIFIPFFLFSALFSAVSAVNRRRTKMKNTVRKNLLVITAVLFVSALCAVIESFSVPYVILKLM